MGDSAPSTGSQTRQLLGSLAQYAPDVIKAISGTLPGTASAQLAAEQAVAPGYENLYRQNQLATAGTEADVVEGPGQRLVSAADKYQQQLDPEYYAQRAALSNAINAYLGAYNPTRLTPTEEAQIARGINATTGPVTPSAMNTIRNAQTFGQAGTERWKNFGDAVSRVAAAIPGLKSGISGFDVAKTRGQDAGANTAASNALSSNFGFSSSALGNITSAANAALAKRKDAWDQALAGSQIFANVGQGVGGIMGGMSDVNRKHSFNNIDTRAVLAGLLALPIQTWKYIDDPEQQKHIGPMAQDFKKVFNLGGPDTQIGYLDAIGVLMAAVQELAAEIRELKGV